MPLWNQISFQDAASPTIQALISLHDHAILIITIVVSLVGFSIISLLQSTFSSRFTLEAQQIETIWTIIPASILLLLAIPSLRLLYLIEESSSPSISVNTTGHQWYWSYEYSDFANLEFDSYINPLNDLTSGEFRLLEVDNRTVLPIITETRFLITAADVIHAWAIPSMGVNVDAIPGRLNQTSIFSNIPGIYYGQCSEICGANHSFMPIALELIHPSAFITWLNSLSS